MLPGLPLSCLHTDRGMNGKIILIVFVISCMYDMLVWCHFIHFSVLSMFESQYTLMYSDDNQQALLSSSKHHTATDKELDRSGNKGKAKLK